MKILIVGGGPVGLSAAIHARLAGMEAHVFDRQAPPIDKACGEGLMPGGVQALKAIGVEIPEGQRFNGIRYLQEDLPNTPLAEGLFGHGHGLGIRRLALHQALIHRAEDLGVELHWKRSVKGMEQGLLKTETGDIRGDFILGADGLYSSCQKWANLHQQAGKSNRYGIRRHYQITPWSDFVEVYWNDGCEAYVTPTGPNTIGVAVLWSATEHRPSAQDPLAPFPRLRERLAGVPHASHSRGAGPFARRPKAVQQGQLLLIGDAAGYVDALTGEGLALGFRQAEAAIQAIAKGRPATYRKAHKALVRRPFFLTRSLCWVAAHPRLRQRLIRGLARDPQLFSNALDLMEGHKGWRSLGAWRALRLLGRLARR
jgi:flavin-dependent dehydrogenase